MMKKHIATVAAFLFIYTAVFSQNFIYYSYNVVMQINGEYEGEFFQGVHKGVSVTLDYETARLIIRFDLNGLETNVDTINQILKKSHEQIVFEGKLGLDYINTSSHPPLSFDVNGNLKIRNSFNQITGTGELHHVEDEGDISCMLGMKVPLKYSNLGLAPLPVGINENFEVIITQAILGNDKN